MAEVKGKSVGGRRRMRTTAEKRRIVEETLQPGVSVAVTARKYDLNANVLFGWRRLHRQGLLDSCREPALKLLPIDVAALAEPSDALGKHIVIRRRSRPTVAVPSSTAQIDIEWPSGIRARVVGADAAVLDTVLTTLSQR